MESETPPSLQLQYPAPLAAPELFSSSSLPLSRIVPSIPTWLIHFLPVFYLHYLSLCCKFLPQGTAF